ncbi:LlaJI family restriction endonuclease [Buttiauxella sp. 3AFRM03]|uniref:LlaJI family restriction endonuclease n=1 Tax=Buttiauxella sp. 3AFRM03 TaxID=2479367 RepID=UPI000EF7FAF3|nr:LlaJI family restriction endonuclease [Buttiauxella sp. 3AFRM03]AYN27722.1 LlaJI family restriction endonuclease [Buttiauxella sp. 3AFRM03]
MSDFNFFCDRALVNKVPQELVSYLRLKGFILPEQKKIHFVGLIYLHTGIYIFLPRNSNISSIIKSNVSLKHEIARNLLLSIHKYFQSSRNILTGADENEHITGEKSLNLLITLLEDYNTNGLYKRRNRRIVKNSGKVDWNRTIKKCESTIDENTLNFLDHIGTRSVVDTTNEISKIHAEIIRQISKNFGWLTFASNEHYENSLNHIPISHMDSINKIKSIEHEILLTYSDRDIFLLKSLELYFRC